MSCRMYYEVKYMNDVKQIYIFIIQKQLFILVSEVKLIKV